MRDNKRVVWAYYNKLRDRGSKINKGNIICRRRRGRKKICIWI